MKGKLRKIGLAMSGLMCAGMLFTCVLPAKAANQLCDHYTFELLGWTEGVVVGHDDEGHYIKKDEQGCCAICGEVFVIKSETIKEPHNFQNGYDDKGRVIMSYCPDCDQFYFYIYP